MGYLSKFVGDAQRRRGAAIMAVVNTTPDSFFDGGLYIDQDTARRYIDTVLRDGADLIDVGAESTRPGSLRVPASEQIERALSVIEYAVSQGATVSIDTTSAEVARAALSAGARVVNDVSCGSDPNLAHVVAKAQADLVLMHSRGSTTNMEGFSKYDPSAYGDVVADVRHEWTQAAREALTAGVTTDRIWFDPGLGFHKNAEHSWEIMRRLDEFRDLGVGVVLGASRKSFIGALDDSPPEERLGGSIAACLSGLRKGVSILRVHDVKASIQALLAERALAERYQAAAGGAHA